MGEMAETLDASGTVPADPVHDDCCFGDQGADVNAGEELYGLPSDAERSHPNEAGEIHLTGWEGQREIYFRDLRAGRKEQNRDPKTGFRYAPQAQKASVVDSGSFHSPVGAGLHGLAALADMMETDSDDPEERRKKLEAQQAGSNLGTVIGLAVSAAMVLNTDREDVIHEEEPQTTLNMN